MNIDEFKNVLSVIKNFTRSLWLLLIFNSIQPSYATTDTVVNGLPISEQSREQYKKALSLYRNKKYKQYSELIKHQKSYPLYPYLRYKDLRRNISSLNIQEINQFLNDYRDSPISNKLRTRVLSVLARRQQWKDYLLTYEYSDSVELHCQYLKALYIEGFIEPAFEQVTALWMVGKSQHKSCSYIFDKFNQAGRISKEMIWARIKLVMGNRKLQLAKYLANSLPEKDKILVKFWIKVHRQPDLLLRHKFSAIIDPKMYEILTHAIKNQARKDISKAIQLYELIVEKVGLPNSYKVDIYKKIGLILAKKHDDRAIIWLDKIPEEKVTRYITQWKTQYAIRNGEWPLVINEIDKMPNYLQQKIRWQFWWGYAHKQLGHEIESTEILEKIAKKRDYYGFLAADITQQPYHFEDSPIQLNQAITNKISSLPGILRAKEFYHFKQVANARREWNHTIEDFSDEYLLNAAKIAYNWGWYDRAIASIGMTKNLNDVEVRFPIVYKDIIDNYSNINNLNSAWTYAIIRRESIFIKDAMSHKGALGLMQLLPRTARASARATKTSFHGKRQLVKTKPNIKLGTYYLNHLFKKHHQQTVLATAAYNAGPRNVKRWMSHSEPMDAIRWIESIPFKETREYVTNVLAYNIIYQFRLGLTKRTSLRQLMPPIPAEI